LEVLSDGRRNWDLKPPEDAEAATEDSAAASNVRLNRFVIEDGVIEYRDDTTGFAERVEGLEAVISADSLDGPFRIDGQVIARGVPLGIAAAIGQIGNDRIPANVDVTFSKASATAAFRGLFTVGNEPGAEGTIRLDGTNLGALTGALVRLSGMEGSGEFTSPEIAGPVELDAAFVARPEALRTNALRFQLGSSRGEGKIVAGWGEAPSFDVDLSFSTLDVDELMPTQTAGKEPPPDTQGETVSLPDPAMVLPGAATGKLALAAEAVRYRERVVRQIRVAAEADGGELNVTEARALLPGGGEFSLSGRVREAGGAGRFDGSVTLATTNLRDLLDWFEMAPDGFADGTLAAFSVNGDVFLSPSEAGLSKGVVSLDSATFRGDAAFAPGERPRLGVSGTLDRLDLAAYMGAGAGCFAMESDEPASDPLSLVNGTFRLTIGRVTCPETRLDGLTIDAALDAGVLTLNRFAADQALGLKVAGSGTLRDMARTPTFDVRVEASGSSLRELERVFPDLLPRPAAALGAASFNGRLAGTPQELDLSGNLALGATRVEGQAKIGLDADASESGGDNGGLAALRSIDANARMTSSSLVQFIEQWDLPLTPPATRYDRPVELDGTVRGSGSAMALDLKGSLAGARIAAQGQLNGINDTPSYELDTDIDGADLTVFLRGLGVGFEPADPALGPVKMQATLRGGPESIAVNVASGQAGPVVFNGETTVDLSGDKPKLAGEWRANNVPLDRFMAPDAEEAEETEASREWSTEPFNNDWLDAFDANFVVRADSVTVNKYRFDQPHFTLVVADGALEVRDLVGKLFDGDVQLAMRYGAPSGGDTGVPALSLKMAVSNASLEKALGTAFGVSVLTGPVGFTSEISASGASPHDIVRSLAGQSRLKVGEGILRGIDLPRLSETIKSLNSVDGFGRVLKSALAGGSTRHKGMNTVIDTQNGAFAMKDMVIELDAARAVIGGRADLASWNIDANGRMQLSEHTSAPPIGVDIKGLLGGPQVNYQTRDLQTFVAGEISRAILERATGGGLDQLLGRPSSQETPSGAEAEGTPPDDEPVEPSGEPESEPQESEPQDRTRQLFEGIFRNLERRDKAE
ncbi:MAG: AsmA-like C-terminal region-containing protein, partial [Sphingomonadales bacterium]